MQVMMYCVTAADGGAVGSGGDQFRVMELWERAVESL